MYKDNLFKLIRKEKVVLWAGAGFSLYAGYPSGKQLTEILFENLSEEEKQEVSKDLPLPDLAEKIYRLRLNKKNAIFQVLRDTILYHTPLSTEYHDKLATIPHFKTIITTNYDHLFEKAYGSTGQVLILPKDLPYLDDKKVHIFKAHGDFSAPDSIIITNSDYNHFFDKKTENDVYWTAIKNKFLSKNILFLGYNLSDPNVSVIFDKVSDALGEHMQEAFLVAPNLPVEKVDELSSKGIFYINSKGEDFIEELLENIKENIVEDFDKGYCSAETFRKIVSNNDLVADLKGEVNSFKLAALSGKDGKFEGNIDFTVENDNNFIGELKDFIAGKTFGEFEIPENKLIKTRFSVRGLKLLGAKEGIILKLRSLPKRETKFEIVFDDGFGLDDVPVKIFGSPHGIQIEGSYKNLSFWLKLDPTNKPDGKIDFKFTHKDVYSKTKDEIGIHTLLKNIASGQSFTIHHESGLNFSKAFPIQEELLSNATQLLGYFEKLKTIELNYNIRFVDIHSVEIGKESYELILVILSAIKDQSITYHYEGDLVGEILDLSDRSLEMIAVLNLEDQSFFVHDQSEEVVMLHGKEIKLGYKNIEVLNAYVSNLDALRDKTESLGKVGSKIQKIKIYYTKEPVIQ